jgi:hypothetical protein
LARVRGKGVFRVTWFFRTIRSALTKYPSGIMCRSLKDGSEFECCDTTRWRYGVVYRIPNDPRDDRGLVARFFWKEDAEFYVSATLEGKTCYGAKNIFEVVDLRDERIAMSNAVQPPFPPAPKPPISAIPPPHKPVPPPPQTRALRYYNDFETNRKQS